MPPWSKASPRPSVAGIALYDTMRSFVFGAVSGIMIVIIAAASLFDILSQLLRRVVIDGEDHLALVAHIAALAALFALVGPVLARVIEVDGVIRAL